MENFEVFCWNAKEANKAKIYLTKNDAIWFEPREKANIFKKLYYELVKIQWKNHQLQVIDLIATLLRITILIYLTIKKTSFSYSMYSKMLLENPALFKCKWDLI